MADVKIRKLSDWVVETLKIRARSAGRSLEEELRHVLTEAAMEPRRRFLERATALRADIRDQHGILPDSTPGIRQERDRA
ncbi:MAG: hypothetical protein KJ904_07205 [Alphaproteobacteria bacterium]|nr:hypothetical protein [Alphaproteobacteria bacterium]MBU0795853.1 hypothetical protein [Alphaproteobacteria bacterium]MBU0886935.1 hypothetical protein [Alphaproteobacteria bacterium]MBU1813209.1 hypothetical protein [Alphaproteobacteria bacterium]MBU2091204.1 hypothetical protein [Alphaproteobacteria bacterium]